MTIPESATSTVAAAFYNCRRLANVNIPASITHIDIDAFTDCKALKDVPVDEANMVYRSINGVVFSKNGTRAFRGRLCLSCVRCPSISERTCEA